MAVTTDRLNRQIVFALEKKSEKIFENIFLNNGVLAKMGLGKRVKIVRGGNRFDERIHLGQNPNTSFKSRLAQIDTDFSNTWYTGTYGQAVCSGAAIMNLVEIDQAQGDKKLDDVIEKTVEELNLTFPNVVSDALMSSSAGSADPVSVVESIEKTAAGDQTSSLGGISRADHTGSSDKTDQYQNQYTNTAIDLSGAAGIATATKFSWDCSPGGGALNQQPDVGLTTTGVMAKASGAADVLRRYSVDGKMLKLGFDNLKILNATIMADRNVGDNDLYFLNTNYMRLQVLAGPKTKAVGSVQTIGDGKQSIQLQVRPLIESSDFLNQVIKAYLVMNLTFGGLRQHGVADNVTEA